jgi:hypothetical protein
VTSGVHGIAARRAARQRVTGVGAPDLSIKTLGLARIESPLAALLDARQTTEHYVDEDDRVLLDDTLSMVRARGGSISDSPSLRTWRRTRGIPTELATDVQGHSRSAPDGGGGVLLRIEDSGIGLPADRLAVLNTRLAGAPRLDSGSIEHMGLAVVRRLAPLPLCCCLRNCCAKPRPRRGSRAHRR